MFSAMAAKLSLLLFLIVQAQSQECVQNLPGFANQGGEGVRRFSSGTQALIPDYYFDCYGNVTQWGAFVVPPGRNGLHTLVFQVWRRTGGGQGTTGCYDLIGDNHFQSVSPAPQSQGQILKDVPVDQQIKVHPGDVIGFYYASASEEDSEDHGVELQRTSNPPGGRPVVVTAWYGPVPTSNAVAGPCMIRIGRDSGYDLRSSTSNAPIITASVAVSTPSPSPSTSSVMLPAENILATVQPPPLMITQTGTSQTTQTLQTQAPVQFSALSTPQSTPFVPPITTIPPVGSGLEPGAIVAIVIIVLIVVVLSVLILVFILILALRKRSKKMADSMDNPEYSLTGHSSSFRRFNNSSSISKLTPAKPPIPQSRPKPHVSDYVVAGPQIERFSELVYRSIPSKPVQYENTKQTSSNPALYEPVYADASGKETAAKAHFYHSVEPHGVSDQEQYYSDPTSPSQPLDLAPPTHVYQTLDSRENSGQVSVHYEDPTLQAQGADDALNQVGIYVPTQEQRAALGTRYEVPETNLYNQLKFFTEDTTYWAPASTTSRLYSQLAAKKYREIPRNQIRLLEELGSGQFGQVCKGMWRFSGCTMEIAVKTLKPNTTEEDRVKFLQEAAIMGQFSHPNIVKLYGVVTVGEPAMIGLEIMTNGDLRGYLKGMDLRQYPDQSEPQRMFVRFAREVAAGMTYLSRKSFVHRDLAARNILLNQSLTCKIGDFGLARNLIGDTYYKSSGGKIPVKWTSPEALLYKKYTTANDVWSYGMVLFEIWSMGHKPFHNLSNSEVIRLANTGHCEPPPPGCPRAIYTLMVECWNPNHQERISFNYISDYLRQSDETLTYWSQEDKSVSPKVHILGAALHSSERLYLDLQHRYKQ